MRTLLSSKKRILSFVILLLLVVGVPVGVYLSQQQQDVRQRAATAADLIVDSFQLTDAGGNVRTTFNIGEDIYVRVKLKNQGGVKGTSNDGSTLTKIYANRSVPITFDTTSTPTLQMKNGEFGAGAAFTYTSIYGSSTQTRFSNSTYSWRRSAAGTFTARIMINANKFVTESNYLNNEIDIKYTIADKPAWTLGKSFTSAPPDYDSSLCTAPTSELVSGLRGCVMDQPVNGKNYGKITNTGSTTRTVGMASYKAYIPYPTIYPDNCPATDIACVDEYNWIWTQTIYSAFTDTIAPGQTKYFEVNVPGCAWQTDVFEGSFIYPSFTPTTRFYSGSHRYLDGYYHIISVCTPVIPTPTPTPTDVPSATPTATETPVPTDTPTPTIIPTDTPSATPTPTTPVPCVTPGVVQNVKINCPNCNT
ncbi:MAG: hypothetical protein AAB478_00780 [Patescibacteria group bacterium]